MRSSIIFAVVSTGYKSLRFFALVKNACFDLLVVCPGQKKKLNKNLATKTKGSGNRKNSSLSKNHSAHQGHDTKGSDFRSAT
jgi:hypothetical protein